MICLVLGSEWNVDAKKTILNQYAHSYLLNICQHSIGWAHLLTTMTWLCHVLGLSTMVCAVSGSWHLRTRCHLIFRLILSAETLAVNS